MTFAEGLVDSLTVRDGRPVLALRLPWYRSLPLSCLESVEVTGAEIDAIAVPGSETDWDLRDRLEVTLGPATAPGLLRVEVVLRIPYLRQAPGVLVVHRTAAETEYPAPDRSGGEQAAHVLRGEELDR